MDCIFEREEGWVERESMILLRLSLDEKGGNGMDLRSITL